MGLASDIIHKHSSFIGFCNSYNYLFKSNIKYTLNKRERLNDKRLCDTWFLYRYLIFVHEFVPFKTIYAFPVSDLNKNLAKINQMLLHCFVQKWSGPLHKDFCNNEKCWSTIDGNLKVPLLNNYLCSDHKNLDPQLSFNYRNTLYKCLASQISLKQFGRLVDRNDLVIYDVFESNKGDYYLVDYNDECPFWASKAQVPAEIIEKYEKKQNKPLSFSKNQKNYIEVCKNKDKTDGVFLDCYNCNIIASFKEINRNESCTQAAITSSSNKPLIDLKLHVKGLQIGQIGNI
ncbi:unnamed protein product [Brachionus calyciflorus]|uniref:Uncharacterized protein n=1 Tax=Brachionus calyciflorus TaxID=104777 RepID=A0A814L1V0_9BILA|nr:unnamed protein product [Brachionus calyciflorus]